MPANLPPTYHAAEERLRSATTPEEKLGILREMLALIPKHKGTEKLQADLKRRISKAQQQSQQRRGSRRTTFDHVAREGAGQVVLLGPPNAGKSALLGALTHAHPRIAPYPFTTRIPQPGMMPFEDIQIQLVDTPAVSPDFTEPWLPGLVRAADLCLLVLSLVDPELLEQLDFVFKRMEASRVRLIHPDAEREDVDGAFERVPTQVVATHRSDDDTAVSRGLLDEILAGCLPACAVDVDSGAGLDELRGRVFTLLRVNRVYTKEPGKPPDRERPFVLKQGSTVLDLARTIHNDVAAHLRFARVWGQVKFDGQPVERDHPLADGDVIELHT